MMKSNEEMEKFLYKLGLQDDEKPKISISAIIENINLYCDFCYESKQFRSMTNEFYKLLEEVAKDKAENIMDMHNSIVFDAEKSYFKAGFSAGVRLLLESLGADI